MDSFTHILMAKKIYNNLSEKFRLNLSRKYLIIGSVRPDYTKNPISHFKDDQIHFFYDKFHSLLNLNPLIEKARFSVELGEVFHYLCDYFCSAHNQEKFKENIWSHFVYERKLYKTAKRLSKNFFKLSNSDFSQISISELFEYKHVNFLKQIPSHETDLFSAFEVCTIVGRKVFNELHLSEPLESVDLFQEEVVCV